MDQESVRKIVHIDMDAFYASVEQRDHPALRGKPIAVGRPPEERGVIATASYEARRYGVHSAMSSGEALRRCPQLVLVPPNFSKYEEISQYLYTLYSNYTDIIERVALDECYLDLSGCGSATRIAREIKRTISREQELTASAGVSINKLIAKIASDINKPDGIFVVPPETVAHFIKKVPVRDINGVGAETLKKIEKLSLGKTCGELQNVSLIKMIDYFGSFGEKLYYFVRGIDERPVNAQRESRSIGTEETFTRDLYQTDEIYGIVKAQLDEVVMRASEKKLRWRTVTLKIKFRNFTQITRSRSVDEFTDDPGVFHEALAALVAGVAVTQGVRLAGVTLSNIEQNHEQLELFH